MLLLWCCYAAGPFVSAPACYDGGSGVSRAGAHWNITAAGELVSQVRKPLFRAKTGCG